MVERLKLRGLALGCLVMLIALFWLPAVFGIFRTINPKLPSFKNQWEAYTTAVQSVSRILASGEQENLNDPSEHQL